MSSAQCYQKPNVSLQHNIAWSPITAYETDSDSEDNLYETEYKAFTAPTNYNPSPTESMSLVESPPLLSDSDEEIEPERPTTSRPRLQEKWIMQRKTDRYEKIYKLRQTFAAVKIQSWYRHHIKRHKRQRYPLRSRKFSPEITRSQSMNNLTDLVHSNDEDYRVYETDSKGTLYWDSSPECLELDNVFSHPLDLNFNKGSTDFLKVYNFQYALPLTNRVDDFSEVLPLTPKKTKKDSKFKNFKKFLKKNKCGNTPSKGQ